jgi:uncharacterized protein with von Willebrand factor type A (vWA) domain
MTDPMTIDRAELAGRFAQLLHAAGIGVTPERAGRWVRALALAAPATTDELYWLARVTLVADHREIAAFDAVFDEVFRGFADVADTRGDPASAPAPHAVERGRERRAEPERPMPGRGTDPFPARARDDAGGGDPDGAPSVIGAPSSRDELLRRRDFGSCTPDELARLRTLMECMDVRTPRRPGRRRRRHRRGDAVDLRASLRAAHRTGGVPAELVRRRLVDTRRRVVLIADVSGSMEGYARAYLYLLHGAVRSLRAETFVFSTRLTRLTRVLAASNPDRALAGAMDAVVDWSGGTRIGEALAEFNDRWGRRGLARGAVVVIVSDGWESGDPAELGRQIRRLSLLAHRIVWVNPRSQTASFEPRTRGMAAALPHVDVMISGHSLHALERVVDEIAADARRQVPVSPSR